ncbi:cytochrome c oxidase assembly protein [Planomonospora corallina]|uniref:Cytochrome c oxidase assembly protein n=1 Tax=Planomonospora corallina TaxID=1806052 RepID=A0ABV8I3X9_9ACTN
MSLAVRPEAVQVHLAAHPDPGHAGAEVWAAALPALVPFLVCAVAYLVAARRAAAAPRGWSRPRTASWLAGCAVAAAAVSPLAHVLLPAGATGHMVQHLLLGMFAPLALALAAPVTLLLRTAPVPYRRRAARLLRSPLLHAAGHPVTAAVLNAGGLLLVTLTPLYAATLTSPVLHHAVHLHYLVAGYLFAWAVAGPDPAPRRHGTAVRVTALVGAAAAHAWLAKHLYAHASTLPPALPEAVRDVADLRRAAQVMYYGGDLAELLLATALFAAWYRRRGRLVPPAGAPGPVPGRLPPAGSPAPDGRAAGRDAR